MSLVSAGNVQHLRIILNTDCQETRPRVLEKTAMHGTKLLPCSLFHYVANVCERWRNDSEFPEISPRLSEMDGESL
jgi:hypothetical protein